MSDPTPQPQTAATLPTLELESALVPPTPLGPESENTFSPTQIRSETNRLPAATNAAGQPAVVPPTAAAPADTAPPPPADTVPPPPPTAPPPTAPPADTPPPPPTNTAPPPPQPEATEGPPVQADVVICHMPGGDASKAETKTVGPDAVASHLEHGDTLGPCP